MPEHRACAVDFAEEHAEWIHAYELNGMRPWAENRDALTMAECLGKPYVSGGDRHALEPATMLNLTRADSFAEFAAEVRRGHSTVLVTRRYREPFAIRILQNLQDVLAVHEGHGRGWKRWDERVFYVCEDGETRSLAALWGDRPALPVRVFIQGVQALRYPPIRFAFRTAFARRQHVSA